MTNYTRRSFVAGSAAFTAGLAVAQSAPSGQSTLVTPGRFKVAVISDEISQDFDHACYVIAKDFGLQWVELRELWGKNLQATSDDDLARAATILNRYGLRVTDIASPLFKVDWPGAPRSQYASGGDLHGANQNTFSQQDVVLERSLALAKRFGTDKVRCFDFWRIDKVKPYRKAINDMLEQAATRAARQGVVLVLENEFACNTATGREAAATLAGVSSANLALNWDPGNAVMRGELDAFPGGWNALPKDRIRHCHVKNAQKDATGKIVWAPVDVGYVDWAAQFRALAATGFADAVSLETHWAGGTTPEDSSRRSWDGMKKAFAQASQLST